MELIVSCTGPTVPETILSLLSTPERDWLIRSDGHTVPVSELQGKVFGLYFFSNSTPHARLCELKQMYLQLMESGKSLEIVFLCSNFNSNEIKKMFFKYFKETPWLALPCSDRRTFDNLYNFCNKYHKNFPPDVYNQLVIVDNFVHTYAMDTFKEYGIQAFPFTRERVSEMEVERFKSLTLDSILFSGNHKYVLDKEGRKIYASDIVGKKIILFLTNRVCAWSCQDRRLYANVIRWCKEIKTSNEAFEMIRVSCAYNQFPVFGKEMPWLEPLVSEFPWLEFPYDKAYNMSIFEKLTKVYEYPMHEDPMLVAFGADGRFITRKNADQLTEESINREDFSPDLFDDSDLFWQIHRHLSMNKNWPMAYND